ncbi:hypothetical protein GALMADRAFT_233367 [Galerina marginata CBS 339.88]|uniref:RING-CH-type domain-containing protein n=1 Tax=Galerina marginata (strain CBS 339.88) TaxID=685588 RepID=A0A067TNW3_GALM3|nr:hypothetical protein GALMADRAFT_233367 [Galerina marginata CBS 339.88]
MSEQEKQCRICLDGVEVEKEVGRLIRPCLCKGSISYVHVKCLQKWRNMSSSKGAFFSCPQCHYHYRFARTRIVGLASNPIILGGISGLLFTYIVMMASFITTFFMSSFERPTSYYSYSYFHFISPFDVAHDLITAAFRVLRDGKLADVFEDSTFLSQEASMKPLTQGPPPSIIKRFVRRFLLGLPLVGAGSLVQMLLSAPFLAPVQWIARYRGSRNRRNNNSRDIAALIVISLVIIGSLRALYKVYRVTQRLTQRVLLRAEDAILEVN